MQKNNCNKKHLYQEKLYTECPRSRENKHRKPADYGMGGVMAREISHKEAMPELDIKAV